MAVHAADMQLAMERLATLSPAELRRTWKDAYGTSPPSYTPDLLMRGIAWRWQEKRSGGLSKAAQKELLRRRQGKPKRAPMKLKPGTRLVRGWQGMTYAVLVTQTGFMFNDRPYRSLSAIAEEITGTRWSGPRFFGLKGAQGAG